MSLFDFYHRHYSKKPKDRDFWLFELSVWLHAVAGSFINIFIPVLLLKSGYSLETVIGYYILYNFFDVPINFLAKYLVKGIGARWVIALGTIASTAFFFTFQYVDGFGLGILVFLAFLSAFYDAMYWVGHIFLFIETTHKREDAARNTSLYYVAQKLASLLGPMVGALFLIFGEEKNLIILTCLFFGLSLIPLIFARGLPDKPTQPILPFRKFFKEPTERRTYLSSALYSIHAEAENVIWPLFIYVFFNNIESVAWIPIIVAVSSILFSYYAGYLHEKNRRRALLVGAGALAVIWLSRLIFEEPIFYYATSFFVSLLAILVSIPIDTHLFTRGRMIDPLSAATYRNVSHMFIKGVFFCILALFINIFHIGFITAASAMILLVFINYLVSPQKLGVGK